MAQETPDQTLQATALVHEAYVRLVDTDKGQQWDSRGHFFAAAAEAMRRILVDRARRKRSLWRGGNCQRVDLGVADVPVADSSEDLIALDEALKDLEKKDKWKADVVKLRFFAGLTVEQTAQAQGHQPASDQAYNRKQDTLSPKQGK